MRTRAWRRYKNYTKAKRKQDIDAAIYAGHTWWHPWYNNLHQYSKNKIHCSCPMCRAKTKRNDYYIVGHSYTMADLRKQMRMTDSEKDWEEESEE